ncbi:hypothetical protein [Paenibacillus sediminis]|uniref:Uncharacterized protein n=1 Tax=Paenibacillus sediminis TaxID=664909 RepID=A0ABS4H0I5_9BACL|nr:hypothetical protein [Paenibacillus sediminis]MBP1936048.1 hypothetical protein [Paenibacillus sediminis]
MKRRDLLTGSRLDATHPPIANRMTFIESLEILEPLYQMTEETHRRLMEEISPLKSPMEAEILDRYRSYLYY